MTDEELEWHPFDVHVGLDLAQEGDAYHVRNNANGKTVALNRLQFDQLRSDGVDPDEIREMGLNG